MTLAKKTSCLFRLLTIAAFEVAHTTISAAAALLFAFIVKPESMSDIALAWIMGFIFEAAVTGVQDIIKRAHSG